MNIETLNIDWLPFLLIPQRVKLPVTGGIYFVVSENGNVEYIGKAINLRRRWYKHECCINLDSPKTCRIHWFAAESNLPTLEKVAILKFNPRLNITHKRLETIPSIESETNFSSVPETAETLGVSDGRVRQFVAEKRVKTLQLGMSEKMLKASEVAKIYEVNSYTVKSWARKGMFPNAQLIENVAGQVWLIPKSDLTTFKRPEQGRPKKS